jgi:hypothetical protein
MKPCAFLLVLLAATVHIQSAPVDDLASPDQAKRDAAAAVQRKTWTHAPRSKWQPLLDKMTAGSPRQAALDLLDAYHPATEGGVADGGSSNSSYRVDDFWIFNLAVNDRANTIISATLRQEPQRIWIAPPKNFTGTWITYYVNGQRCIDMTYRNGITTGLIRYRPDGTKEQLMRMDDAGEALEEIDYYPSGAVEREGKYVGGRPFGFWQHFREDGTPNGGDDWSKLLH